MSSLSPLVFLEDSVPISDSPSVPSAFYISLNSTNIKNIHTLIDSGSSVSFIDSQFALANHLKISNLKRPLKLTLFDGSSATSGLIYQYTDLDVTFPCSTSHSIQFLLTTLDHSTSAVLGYSWLHLKNPSINWVMHEITFCLSLSKDANGDALRSPLPCALPDPELSTPSRKPATAASSGAPPPSNNLLAAAAKISVSMIGAPAARLLSHLLRSHSQSILFSGLIKPSLLKANSAATDPTDPQFESSLASESAEITSKVPAEYLEFKDVFSKIKASTLPPRRPYDSTPRLLAIPTGSLHQVTVLTDPHGLNGIIDNMWDLRCQQQCLFDLLLYLGDDIMHDVFLYAVSLWDIAESRLRETEIIPRSHIDDPLALTSVSQRWCRFVTSSSPLWSYLIIDTGDEDVLESL